jgi:hypothetical protein
MKAKITLALNGSSIETHASLIHTPGTELSGLANLTHVLSHARLRLIPGLRDKVDLSTPLSRLSRRGLAVAYEAAMSEDCAAYFGFADSEVRVKAGACLRAVCGHIYELLMFGSDAKSVIFKALTSNEWLYLSGVAFKNKEGMSDYELLRFILMTFEDNIELAEYESSDEGQGEANGERKDLDEDEESQFLTP